MGLAPTGPVTASGCQKPLPAGSSCKAVGGEYRYNPWNLESIFYYTRPAIGGNARGDEEAGFTVPNFYIPFGAWEDTCRYGLAAIALGEEPVINYWKDKHGFHWIADRRSSLQPGSGTKQRAPAVHFGYRTGSQAELLHRLTEVYSEALNLCSKQISLNNKPWVNPNKEEPSIWR